MLFYLDAFLCSLLLSSFMTMMKTPNLKEKVK